MRSVVAAASPRLWLAAIVVVSTAVRFAFARHMVAPWIMIDEIVYSELAKSFASTGHFAVREVPTSGYGIVYPILISPAYALFRAIPAVYSGIKVLNSLLFSLTAVPAYALARRVVSARGALVVALLTVAVPAGFYAGTIMTENAFYPVFVTAVLALVVALDRSAVASLVVFLAALLVAYETRAQAVALVPAALTAPLVASVLARRVDEVRRRLPLFVVLGGAALVVVAGELARGRSLESLLGAYAAATHGSYDVGTVLHWLQWHLGELDFSVGFVPVFALALLASLGTGLQKRELTLVSTTIAVVAWFAVEVAAFASQPSVQRIEERNLFYLAPLLFTCLVLWLEQGRPLPRLGLAAGIVVTLGLAVAVPYERFIDTAATSDTFGVLFLWSAAEWLDVSAGDTRWLVGAVALGAVCLAIAARFSPFAAVALPVFVLVLFALAIQPVDARTQRASIGALFQGITRSDRDWITATVGSSDPTAVSVLWTGATDRLTVNENEFFNRDVGVIYTLNGPVPGGLAQIPVELDRSDGTYRANGRSVAVHDVLTDTSVSVAGRRIAADTKKGLVLLQVDGRLRASYLTNGIDADGWGRRVATYERFDCGGGVLEATLGSDPLLFEDSQVVDVFPAGRPEVSISVQPGGSSTVHVPLDPRPDHTCFVRFVARRTRVPAKVEPSSTDTRALGVRFLRFQVR